MLDVAQIAESFDGLLVESNQVVECCPDCFSSDLISRLRKRPRYKCRYCESEFEEVVERPPFDNRTTQTAWHEDHVPPEPIDKLFQDADPVPEDCSHSEVYRDSTGCLRCDMAGFASADKELKGIGNPL